MQFYKIGTYSRHLPIINKNKIKNKHIMTYIDNTIPMYDFKIIIVVFVLSKPN